MTRRQREALRDLQKSGHLWPQFGRGGDYQKYSKRTLQALVDAGVAEWRYGRLGSGVLPHIVPKESK